jgi:hypothetical protein
MGYVQAAFADASNRYWLKISEQTGSDYEKIGQA